MVDYAASGLEICLEKNKVFIPFGDRCFKEKFVDMDTLFGFQTPYIMALQPYKKESCFYLEKESLDNLGKIPLPDIKDDLLRSCWDSDVDNAFNVGIRIIFCNYIFDKTKPMIENGDNYIKLIMNVDDHSHAFVIMSGDADKIDSSYHAILAPILNGITNPVIRFANKAKTGGFNDLSDEDYLKKLNNIKLKSKYWYNIDIMSVAKLGALIGFDLLLHKHNIEWIKKNFA